MIENSLPTPIPKASAAENSLHSNPGDTDRRPILITGGAGFIGCNLAHRLCSAGQSVLLFDDLSRAGVERNMAWLRATHGSLVQHVAGDIRDAQAVLDAVGQARQVYHFAAQVAVTTSLVDPVQDFQINTCGTLNVLEAIRAQADPPPLVFTSTNKVYGALADVTTREKNGRYEPTDTEVQLRGIGEDRPLDFYSPYGCSKGAADQYVRDYARSYHLPTVVLRMSCIYGPHQFGTEDQGWVAHFLIRAREGRPITLYGDGKQVRDILFVEDLTDAMLLAQKHMPRIAGQAFNIGGGPAQAISLLELMDSIGDLQGEKPSCHFAAWRVGDQKYYVSDTRRFQELTGWRPSVDVQEGVKRLYRWLCDTLQLSSDPTKPGDLDEAIGLIEVHDTNDLNNTIDAKERRLPSLVEAAS